MVAPPLHARALATSPWARARWLVIAPHADDEILGCGALICEAAKDNRVAAIVFLTDGAGSHPCETVSDGRRLAAQRRREAIAAIRAIAPSMNAPIFLDWPDAHPYAIGSPDFVASTDRLARLCERCHVDAIAVTGRDEPHCDHVAAFEVAQAAARRSVRSIRVFEYIVWAAQPPGREFIALRTKPMSPGQRKIALAQHRSQMTPVAGPGFQVPAQMRTMPSCDVLYTRR